MAHRIPEILVIDRSPLMLVVALFAAAVAGCGTDDPNAYARLSSGAFVGANAQLMGNLIANTTGIPEDSVGAVLIAGTIGRARLSGQADSGSRRLEALALVDVNGLSGQIGAVGINGTPLLFRPTAHPPHYGLDTSASTVFDSIGNLEWMLTWPAGTQGTLVDTLPSTFGVIALSTGPTVSLAALDAGQMVGLTWSQQVAGSRVYVRAFWQPESGNPALASYPIPILFTDAGSIEVPGRNLSRMIRRNDGRLVFVFNRGRYRHIELASAGVHAGSFVYASDTVFARVIQ